MRVWRVRCFFAPAVLSHALLTMLGVLICLAGQAQFTIIDDLRGNNYPDIIIGGPGAPQGEAYFTSGIVDPVGSGWLRLTEDKTNQRGFAYIDRSFPSGMGVLVDFEYKMWRTASDGTYQGADGLSVFLFDADADFRLGGYGGSLGYAPNTNSTPAVTQGLAGGYVGVGIDAYGNFSNPTEGRNGGDGREPNSIVLRGPTTGDANTTNRYLAGVQLSDDVGANELDYDHITGHRPASGIFYRRVQITIFYNEAASLYDIVVSWTKEPGGDFTELITYQTKDPPPARMKVGFAASTGSGFNYHEIRNILVTTLGNLRTVKLADRDYLIPANATGGENNNEVTYTIEVVNDTPAPIDGIVLRDTIKDAHGNVLTSGPGAVFEITGITSLDADAWLAPPVIGWEGNIIDGLVSIKPRRTGRIQVTGILHQTPLGNHIVNTVKLHVPEGTDQDTLNNISHVRTPVYADGVDLILGEVIPDARCINFVEGNAFTLQVSNLGTHDADLMANSITVTVSHPQGLKIEPIGLQGWTWVSSTPDLTSHEFRLDDPSVSILRRGFTHPDAIRLRLTPELTDIPSRDAYTVTAVVKQEDDTANGNEGNNTSDASVQNCHVTSNPMIRQPIKW